MSLNPRSRAAGFTLVEVLVAMLVLSVGLLGIVKLSFSAVQANSSAYMRSQSSALMQQIIDNMHANRNQAVVAQAYQIAYGVFPGAPATDCSVVTTCVDTDITAYDLFIWKQRLAAALPNGDGQVILTPTILPNGNAAILATVSVQWDDSVAQWAFGTPATVVAAPQSLTVQTMP